MEDTGQEEYEEESCSSCHDRTTPESPADARSLELLFTAFSWGQFLSAVDTVRAPTVLGTDHSRTAFYKLEFHYIPTFGKYLLSTQK